MSCSLSNCCSIGLYEQFANLDWNDEWLNRLIHLDVLDLRRCELYYRVMYLMMGIGDNCAPLNLSFNNSKSTDCNLRRRRRRRRRQAADQKYLFLHRVARMKNFPASKIFVIVKFTQTCDTLLRVQLDSYTTSYRATPVIIHLISFKHLFLSVFFLIPCLAYFIVPPRAVVVVVVRLPRTHSTLENINQKYTRHKINCYHFQLIYCTSTVFIVLCIFFVSKSVQSSSYGTYTGSEKSESGASPITCRYYVN